jgi:2-polyprenyl-6-hydroxyphenyl methylase/3-demethylubiquinone-9 3-methyltransferase
VVRLAPIATSNSSPSPVRARRDAKGHARPPAPLAPNDPRQYDDLVDEWWQPQGRFAMLHWLADSRARLLPPARPGAVLLDVACGGGLLAEHVARTPYRHLGIDISLPALRVARAHGVDVVAADARCLPFPDGFADVVVAGEVFEHVPDLPRVVAEVCRVLRPGGTLICDTIAATRQGRFVSVTVAERIPGGPPRGLHDPALFVDRAELVRECALHGVSLSLRGLLPHPLQYARWMLRRRGAVRMVPVRSTAVLFQGLGIKATN